MKYAFILMIVSQTLTLAQKSLDGINLFLGILGNHGQFSSIPSLPFSMLSIESPSDLHPHTDYEYKDSRFLRFMHTSMKDL